MQRMTVCKPPPSPSHVSTVITKESRADTATTRRESSSTPSSPTVMAVPDALLSNNTISSSGILIVRARAEIFVYKSVNNNRKTIFLVSIFGGILEDLDLDGALDRVPDRRVAQLNGAERRRERVGDVGVLVHVNIVLHHPSDELYVVLLDTTRVELVVKVEEEEAENHEATGWACEQQWLVLRGDELGVVALAVEEADPLVVQRVSHDDGAVEAEGEAGDAGARVGHVDGDDVGRWLERRPDGGGVAAGLKR